MMILVFKHLGCFLPAVAITRKKFASFICYILKYCLLYHLQQYPDAIKFEKDLHFTISVFNQLQNFCCFLKILECVIF